MAVLSFQGIFFAIFVAFLVWAIRAARRQAQLVEAGWRETARLLGGRFEPSTGPWWKKSPIRIVAHVEGVPVLVDHYTVSSGKSQITYTRIAAEAEAPPGFRLGLHEEGFFSTVGKALGAQDVIVGDAEFDRLYVVKTNDEDLARLWLDGPACRALVEARGRELKLDADKLLSVAAGLVSDAGKLTAAVRAAALVAGGGLRAYARWQQLAGELGGQLSAPVGAWPGGSLPPIEVEHHGALASIALARGAASDGGPFCTVVRIDRRSARPHVFVVARQGNRAPKRLGTGPFEAAYALPSDAPTFTDELRQDVVEVGPQEIHGDDEGIRVVLDGVQLDAARLKGAIVIAAALAAPAAEGPYR